MSIPKSTSQLRDLATVTVDRNRSIKQYFRSANQMIKQARIYELEEDWERAYVLYMKYTTLGIDELPKHPSYSDPENKENVKTLKNKCLQALDALEGMKPRLDKAYNEHKKRLKQTKEADQAAFIERQTSQWQSQKRPVDVEQSTVIAASDWNIQDALKGVAGIGINESTTKPISSSYHYKTEYPSPALYNQSDGYVYHSEQNYSSCSNIQTQLPPLVPPKINNDRPALPPKAPVENNQRLPELPPKIELQKDNTKKSNISVDASVARGERLRRMLLPKRLHSRFLSIAERNTQNKIETCGILAGELKNNILKVTTLIIPKQTGTSDMCTTENEEELFDIQDKQDLLTFGWIHTHPTQSCFLSSVDLHTHCSYQLMLPEAIAIVCAPSQSPNFGIFRLTDPPGLDIISSCKQKPAFHPHPDLPIYTGAKEAGGHVEISDYNLDIIDLRTKK